jgi:sec-independent protein translocase protein TatB
MFDFSWSEILLIGVVALVVIGPKDLPRVLRTVGQWANRARSVAREFQFQIDEMVRNSELDEVRKTMNAAASGDMDKTIRDMVDPTGEIEKSVASPEMLGETPTMPATQTGTETPPAATMPPLMPTIDAPVPPFLQSVLQQRVPEPVPVAPATPAEPEAAEVAPDPASAPEPKSGTHG